LIFFYFLHFFYFFRQQGGHGGELGVELGALRAGGQVTPNSRGPARLQVVRSEPGELIGAGMPFHSASSPPSCAGWTRGLAGRFPVS